MENLNEVLGGLAILTGAVLIVFIIAKYTYQLKKLMIEKGLVPASENRNLRFVDAGCIVIGLGVGLLVSSIFTTMKISEDTMDLLVWGTISIFGGLSLIVAHFIRKKVEK